MAEIARCKDLPVHAISMDAQCSVGRPGWDPPTTAHSRRAPSFRPSIALGVLKKFQLLMHQLQLFLQCEHRGFHVHGTYCKSKQWHMHSLSLSLSLLKAQLIIGERTIHGAKKKFFKHRYPQCAARCSNVLFPLFSIDPCPRCGRSYARMCACDHVMTAWSRCMGVAAGCVRSRSMRSDRGRGHGGFTKASC
jgi:hypothetical protein